MAFSNEALFKNYNSRMDEAHATTAHDWHLIEIEKMSKEMITSAL